MLEKGGCIIEMSVLERCLYERDVCVRKICLYLKDNCIRGKCLY